MLTNSEILDQIFREARSEFSLTEFEDMGRSPADVLTIERRVIESGRFGGETAYFVKSLIKTRSGQEWYQVLNDRGVGAPEEIVRQLWLHKLMTTYGYAADQLDVEVTVHFGTQVNPKAADIVAYAETSKQSPRLIIECKEPKSSEGIEQLKSYMNSQGAPVALWSNGSERLVLYRAEGQVYEDTLPDIPNANQSVDELLARELKVDDLRETFNFKKVIQDLEELVLADSGVDEFNEIFKLIFAKLWDEKSAEKTSSRKTRFRKSKTPDETYDRINALLAEAINEWPGIFDEETNIDLSARHLHVCVGPIESLRLMGSNLRIMDDAFEYLLPGEAKKKKGQFFTPRSVVEMCVRMLNPKPNEYVLDPACGSGGFLVHTMDWVLRGPGGASLSAKEYASRYLWGIDFEQRAAKTARALMLIAGDGHTNIFGPDVNSLNPQTWYDNGSGRELLNRLRASKLTVEKIPRAESLGDSSKAWKYFGELKFDVILANPPFAGEIKDRETLGHYDLAKPALARAGQNKQAKEERDVLFIERILAMLRPGGRAGIVLPQGKLNNPSLGHIRRWLIERARLVAVVGLEQNTFKPHTGTKTSVIFVQKYTSEEIADRNRMRTELANKAPDFKRLVRQSLEAEGELGDHELRLLGPVFAAFQERVSFDLDLTNDEGEVLDPEEYVKQLELTTAKLEERQTELDQRIKQIPKQRSSDVAVAEDSNAVTEVRARYRELSAEWRKDLRDVGKQLVSAKADLEDARFAMASISERAQLELALATPDVLQRARMIWLEAESTTRFDYPVFMAVSERSGKDSKGRYVFLPPEAAGAEEKEGHEIIDQDLVDFALSPTEVSTGGSIDGLKIAESFIGHARQSQLDWWS